jgi:hypothetical protein
MAFAGVVYAARSAEKRQRNELIAAEQRQRRNLHREKLEEALRLLLAIKEWGDESTPLASTVCISIREKSEDMLHQYDIHKKLSREGEAKYEMVLAILEIYSEINDANLRLGKPFTDFNNGITNEILLSRESNHEFDAAGMVSKESALTTACNDLVTDVREEIRANYMP